MRGKSDPIDATEAARAVIAGTGLSQAKDTTTPAESLRFLLTARARLVVTATALANTIASRLITAPEPVRATYRGLKSQALIARLAATRRTGELATPGAGAAIALRDLARTHRQITDKAAHLEAKMRQILTASYPWASPRIVGASLK